MPTTTYVPRVNYTSNLGTSYVPSLGLGYGTYRTGVTGYTYPNTDHVKVSTTTKHVD